MTPVSTRLSLGFSCIGHLYAHLLMLLFPVVILTLEKEWGLPYDELLPLALAGAILFGAAALPAGWAGDRFGPLGLMVLFFVGTGLACIATGFARTPLEMTLGLAATGLLASIYHPVGIAWLVQVAVHRGRALGVSGVFGNLGVAAASLVAGVSIDLWGWRAAFIIPGVVCVATGLALWACIRIGWITPLAGDHRPAPPASRDDIIRAFVVLTITMLCAGLIYQAMSVVLPKLFAERLAMTAGMSATSLGAVVSAVYLVSGMAQLAGGYFSDWFSMKWTYVGSYLLQAPLLAMIALIDGWSLVGTTVVMMALMTAAAPAESGLLARYTPTRWRSTAFGAKFVLTLGVSALGVPLVSFLYGATGGFAWVFYVLAMLAATLFVSGLWIPGGPAAPAVRPVTATAPAE